MTKLTLVAAKEEISQVERHIAQMDTSQQYLKSMGLLEGRHQATIPPVPKLDSLVFSMAQAAIEGASFRSNVAANINIKRIVNAAFSDFNKAYASLSEAQTESLLSKVLETVNGLKELTDSTVKFLGAFKRHASDLENPNTLISSISRGKGFTTSNHGADTNIASEHYKAVMNLSPETNHVTKDEIIEALNQGDFKGELFTVSTLKAGIKFQLTKEAIQAIKQTLDNLQTSQKYLDQTCREFEEELKRIAIESADNALSREEHRANIMERIKGTASKAN